MDLQKNQALPVPTDFDLLIPYIKAITIVQEGTEADRFGDVIRVQEPIVRVVLLLPINLKIDWDVVNDYFKQADIEIKDGSGIRQFAGTVRDLSFAQFLVEQAWPVIGKREGACEYGNRACGMYGITTIIGIDYSYGSVPDQLA